MVLGVTLAWFVLAGWVGGASAEVVADSLTGACEVENNYGRSMAVLGDGRLAVGSSGEFCGWVDFLDATGTSMGSLQDPDETTFGWRVAAIGRDVLVGLDTKVLRIVPATATVRAEYELPDRPSAIAVVGRLVAVLVARNPQPDVVYVFDARTGALRRTIPNPDPTHDLRPLLVRVGRRLATLDFGGTVRLIAPKSGAVRVLLRGKDPGGAIAADGKLMAVTAPGVGNGTVELRDRRGRILRTIEPPGEAGCFGSALALLDDLLLVGAPCTTLLEWFEGAAYLYSTSSGRLLARFAGRGENEKLATTVALFPGAVALGGRGPDTADSGIVRIFPR